MEEIKIEVFGHEIKTKPCVIHIDRKKFTDAEMEELEDFRQLAIRLKVLGRMFGLKWQDAPTKKERDAWWRCCELMDELKCGYDDLLFQRFQQLPDKAVHVFY